MKTAQEVLEAIARFWTSRSRVSLSPGAQLFDDETTIEEAVRAALKYEMACDVLRPPNPARKAALQEAIAEVERIAEGWQSLATPAGEKGVYQSAVWTISDALQRLVKRGDVS